MYVEIPTDVLREEVPPALVTAEHLAPKPRRRPQPHPDDVDAHGLKDGILARVRSTTGEVTVPVEVDDGLRPGVVSLPHGFGHDLDGVRLEVARRQAGVNSNVLTDRHDLDVASGNAVLNAIPVDVAPA